MPKRNAPQTPRLTSVPLPVSPELRTTYHQPLNYQKPTKSTSSRLFGFFRSSSRTVEKPSHNTIAVNHYHSNHSWASADAGRGRQRVPPRPVESDTSEETEESEENNEEDDEESESEEDQVVYRPPQTFAAPIPRSARPTIAQLAQTKTLKEIEMAEREEQDRLEREAMERQDKESQDKLYKDLKRRVKDTRILEDKEKHMKVSKVKSKAAKEIEREEQEERERQERERRAILQRQQQQQRERRPSFTQPSPPNSDSRPLKSCLKRNSSQKPPVPQQPHNASPASSAAGILKRRESSATATYYSDTEMLRSQHHHHKSSSRQSQAYQQPPPMFPLGFQPTEHGHSRPRNQSFSSEGQPPRHVQQPQQPQQPVKPPPVNKANYVKACFKEVPMKEEAISLSWQLVDYQTRKHAKYPALFFDAAFNPRIRGFEPQVLPYGEERLKAIQRDMEVQNVSPHAFMTEMFLFNDTLRQWPVVVRNPSGVRCVDVFRAIYDTYAIPLTPEELMQIGPEYIERCKPTFEQRCKDGPGLTGVVHSKGICRIDLLRSKKFFKGLTPYTGPGKRGPNYWQLHFERIEDLPLPTGSHHHYQPHRYSRR